MKKGFTLIELLVVIAIIGLLSSVVLASLDGARKKARDARRLADFNSMSTALQLYYDKYEVYPTLPSYTTTLAGHNKQFEDVAAILVSEGFLSTVPEDPNNPLGYLYHKYAAGHEAGSLIVTRLESISPTTAGPHNSCRPWTTTNWCSSTQPTNYYCLCHPY